MEHVNWPEKLQTNKNRTEWLKTLNGNRYTKKRSWNRCKISFSTRKHFPDKMELPWVVDWSYIVFYHTWKVVRENTHAKNESKRLFVPKNASFAFINIERVAHFEYYYTWLFCAKCSSTFKRRPVSNTDLNRTIQAGFCWLECLDFGF